MKRLKLLFVLVSAVFVLTSCNTESGEPEVTGEQTAAQATQEESELKPIVYEIDPAKPVIALTFDDGPNTTTTNQVLDKLEKYQVKASFFLVGANINDETSNVVKRAYGLGCEIDNHSKTHSDMSKMAADDIAAEVKFVSDKVKEITGEATVFFRPPYIAVSDAMYDNIDMPFICGVGCNDWDDKIDVERRLKSLRRQIKDGCIILLHDAQGNDKTVELLDTLIPELKEQGYQFATVKELFEAKGVAISGDDTNLYTQVGVSE